jgi:hypothetical protein
VSSNEDVKYYVDRKEPLVDRCMRGEYYFALFIVRILSYGDSEQTSSATARRDDVSKLADDQSGRHAAGGGLADA